jgi:hypothetical protein
MGLKDFIRDQCLEQKLEQQKINPIVSLETSYLYIYFFLLK